MWYDIAIMIISLGIILFSAGLFTNGVEWLGKKLNLTEGAVGSVLAAVGTAMPETMIPIIAIVFGTGADSHEIGIGAILGAPFMLGTLALFLVGTSVLVSRGRRAKNYPRIEPDAEVVRRDLGFFLIVYSLAIIAALLPAQYKLFVAAGLVLAYFVFAYRTITCGCKLCDVHEIDPLFIARRVADPSTRLVVLQVLVAFVGIVIGAKLFVDGISAVSSLLGVPAFIVALLIAPVATEMPEKVNSIIWLMQGKDTLALGNITGAMVFQSSVIPAIGIALTPWVLTQAAFISAILALVSALVVYLYISWRNNLDSRMLLCMGGTFYGIFVLAIVTGMIH